MTTRNKNLAITFFSLATIVLLPFCLYLQNNRFFYIDDKVADYIPKLLDIARILQSGEFPFLSTNLMNGGIYAAEFQEGIYNPVILLSALLLDSFNNLALGACVLTIFFLLVAFGGYYLLAVGFGIRRGWANIFALSVSLNCFLLYWYTSAWFNPVNGTAFLPYALWSSLILMRRVTLKTSFIFLLSCFMAVSAGWPSTLLVLAAFMVLMLGDILFIQKDRKKFIQNLLIYFGTALVCTIPVLPLLLSNGMFTRASVTQNLSNFLTGSLQGLVMFSFPAFKDFMHTWAGYKKLPFNTYYAAWYALPLLGFLDFKKINIWKKHIWLLLSLTITFGIATLGPEHMGPLRFPIRMLQYYHIFGILLILLLSETCGFSLTRQRLVLSLSFFAFQAILALQVNPENLNTISFYFAALVVLTIVTFFILKRKEGLEVSTPWVLIGTIALLVSIYAADYHGRGVDWNVPAVRSEYSSLGYAEGGYLLFNGGYLGSQKKHREFRPATTGLIWNDKIVNGYSPLGNKFFRQKISISDHGNITSWKMTRKGMEFFEVDPVTGLELLELMKVSRIISFKGKWGANMNDAASDSWKVDEKEHTFVFNHRPYDYPGHISWLDKGIEIVKVVKQQHRTEQYLIRNNTPSEGRIVFARLWWPGYRATINGKELPLERYAGFLISVLVPKQAQGNLSLTFTPPGFYLGLILSFIGLALVLVVNLFACKSNRRPRDSSKNS
jgi:hypothetical protein